MSQTSDLIIGQSAQVSRYMDPNTNRVCARSIPDSVFRKTWDRVYLCFAEQRTKFAENKDYKQLFFETNVKKTTGLIGRIKAKKIIVFSTTELWNNLSGPIDISTPFDFKENYYTDSKYELTKYCQQFEHIAIAYPFNFNSTYRSADFLFGKVFSALKERKHTSVFSLNLQRELLHATFVANVCQRMQGSSIIGSGQLIQVADFVKDLFSHFELDYHDYITEKDPKYTFPAACYAKSPPFPYTYQELLKDTVDDFSNPAGS